MSALPSIRARSAKPSSGIAQTGLLERLQLRPRWDALGHRERRLTVVAILLVAGALLWWLALAPALATLRQAREQHTRLDAQLQDMQTMKVQAGALAALPKVSLEDARRVLEAGLKQSLGASAQMSMAGNRVTVTLKAAPADALAQWLLQARINARALPVEIRLVKAVASPAGTTSASPAVASGVNWDGAVVLSLPER